MLEKFVLNEWVARPRSRRADSLTLGVGLTSQLNLPIGIDLERWRIDGLGKFGLETKLGLSNRQHAVLEKLKKLVFGHRAAVFD